MEKIVAVIGRPNVGKSTLFNRILGRRVAIVHAVSGVTRDRNYGEAEWTGKRFFLIDTGGFVPDSEEEFNKQIRAQVKIAIDEADKILFLVDGLGGIHPIDVEIAQILRRHSKGKEIILAANKVDNTKRDLNISDFYSLGLGEPLGISALSGRNVAELLDEITKDFSLGEETEDTRIKFAIVGRPNAGKSSIANAILKEERNIVTSIPGTTRDSIDSIVKFHGEDIILIDTAGLRKKSKIKKNESLEQAVVRETQEETSVTVKPADSINPDAFSSLNLIETGGPNGISIFFQSKSNSCPLGFIICLAFWSTLTESLKS